MVKTRCHQLQNGSAGLVFSVIRKQTSICFSITDMVWGGSIEGRMLISRFVVVCAVALATHGCITTPRTSTYFTQAPTPLEIQNTLVVAEAFEFAWDKLVKNIAATFYVINNIDKESRLINVTFSSDRPELFVTGGNTTRTIIFGKENIPWSYDPASSAKFMHVFVRSKYNPLPMEVRINRRVSLEGRANIYLAPEGSGTILTVNCRYILAATISDSSFRTSSFGQVFERVTRPTEFLTASFNTNRPSTVDWNGDVTFRSTGKFESDILSILK